MNQAKRQIAAPHLLLGLALVASTALLLALSSGLTFFQDTWAFLIQRRPFTAQSFLEPHNEHIVVIPVAIEKLLIAIFGMTSAGPERIVFMAFLVGTALLLFVYLRRRVGPWPALLGTVLVLFLGPAWQVLLWPFEIALVGSTAAGIAALLALDREDARGDLIACLLVVVAIGFSSLGLCFAAGVFVDVVVRRHEAGWRRLYVPGVGMILYAAWYLAYGHDAESSFSAHNVLHSPVFVVEGISASVGALSGLSVLSGNTDGRPFLGFALLVVLCLLLLRWWRRERPAISPRLWPAAASGAAFWILAAFNRSPGRDAPASRYMHFGAILVLMVAADLLRGVRFGSRALAIGAGVVVVACAINITKLEDGSDYLHEQTVLTKADLGALRIASKTVSPYFYLAPRWAGTTALIDVNGSEYFPAEREYGTPAYTPAELVRAPRAGRRQADLVLAAALGLRTTAVPGAASPGGGSCVAVPPGFGAAGRGVKLSSGTTRIEVAPGPSAFLALRRFATGEFPVELEPAPGGETTELTIPADRSSRPWYLQVKASQRARVCAG